MAHDFGLWLDGEQQYPDDPEFERVQIERDLDGVGQEYRCGNCDEPIADYPGKGLVHEDGSRWCLRTEHHGDQDITNADSLLAHLREEHDLPADAEPMDLATMEREHEDYPEHADEIADPERIPFSWANSATIQLDEDDDSITVTISVGDPRGAFAFTIRRIPDSAESDLAGRLLMHVPYPGESLPHEKLTHHHEGTYLIG